MCRIYSPGQWPDSSPFPFRTSRCRRDEVASANAILRKWQSIPKFHKTQKSEKQSKTNNFRRPPPSSRRVWTWNNHRMMTTIEQAIEKVKSLSEDRQAYAAEVLKHIAAIDNGVFQISGEYRAEILEGLEQANLGEDADQEAVKLPLRHRPMP